MHLLVCLSVYFNYCNSIRAATNQIKKTKFCVFSLVLMTRANDELSQTGVVAEQQDPSASNTAIENQLTENQLTDNNEQWSQQDVGPAESAKTEEKIVTFVKKVKI